MNYEHRQDAPLSTRLNAIAGVPKLFLSPSDERDLGDSTRELYSKAPEPREIAVLAHGNFVSLPEDEKRVYENRVVSFFLVRLTPAVIPGK